MKHTNFFSKQEGEQDIQMLNDKKVVTHYSDPKKAQASKPVNQGMYLQSFIFSASQGAFS